MDKAAEKIQLNQQILDEVKAKIPKTTATFPATEESDPYQFVSRIKQYCNSRYKAGSLSKEGYCAFVFIPTTKTRELSIEGSLIRRLISNQSCNLRGKLFVAYDVNLSRLTAIDVASDNEQETYNNICNEIENLERSCQQKLCHVVVDFNVKTTTSFYEGSDADFSVYNFNHDTPEKYTREKLEAFAEKLHEKETKYPASRMKPWKNQKKYELLEGIEDRIVLRFAVHWKTR